MNKLLIVDDERYELELLKGIVTSHFKDKMILKTAENGRQAIEVAMLWKPDIIFMDIEMPGINGIAAAQRILSQLPECKLLFVTAYSLFNYAYQAVKLGAYDYILKPVNPEDLISTMRRLIAQNETEEQLEKTPAVTDETEEGPVSDKMHLLMENVKQYLQNNYMLYSISLDSISEVIHINASYFSMMFKKYFGVNFVDYLTEIRINAARELLADPFLTTAEVGMMAGYENPNYFTRVFKKSTGMTPTEYRRALGKRGEEKP